jgi:hypothetical protein
VARRLAAVEVGDGAVHAACAAAQREVIDGARVRAAGTGLSSKL